MPIVENFEALTLGNLTGQDGWGGGYTNFQVANGTAAHGGSKGISASSAGGSLCEKDYGAPSTSGSQIFYFRTTDVTSAEVMHIRFKDFGASTNVIIIKTLSGNLQYYNGSSYQTISAVSNNTWYKVQVDWLANNTARYRIDGGTPTSYDSMGNNMTNGIDGVYLGTQLSGTAYWDDFEAVPSSSSIKTINGLALASVKTVNGLSISSVKTVNGLA